MKKENVLLAVSGAITVDEMLPFVGELGRFQMLVQLLFCILMIPQTFPILMMYFAALSPDWKCSTSSANCTLNGTFSPSNSQRCAMPRNSWQYTEPAGFSIVTQFDLSCGREWIAHMTSSVFFIGWGIGAVVLGWVADNFGRRFVLMPSLALLFLVGFVTAFSPDPAMFVVMRFLSGFFVPGSLVQMFIMSSEIVGHRYRPVMGIGLWFFWTVGLCFLGLQAYFIRTWKVLYIACTIPYVAFVALLKFVPESIRWLNVDGRTEQSMAVLRRIAKVNRKIIPTDITLAVPDASPERHKTSPLDLFRSCRLARVSLIQSYAWFVNGLVYYGLSLAADDLGGNLYRNYVLSSVVEFPAAVLAIYFCNRLGRKKTVIASMLIGSVACILVAFVPASGRWKIFRVFMGIFGKFCVTLSFDSIYTWSVEIHPTSVRAEGMGFLQVSSKFGAAAAPWVGKALSRVHFRLPFIIMGILAFLAGFLMIYLPETKGKATAEVLVLESGQSDSEQRKIHRNILDLPSL